MINDELRHGPYEKIKYPNNGVFYCVNKEYVEETCPVIINGNTATNGYVVALLNEWNDWIIELLDENERLKKQQEVIQKTTLFDCIQHGVALKGKYDCLKEEYKELIKENAQLKNDYATFKLQDKDRYEYCNELKKENDRLKSALGRYGMKLCKKAEEILND